MHTFGDPSALTQAPERPAVDEARRTRLVAAHRDAVEAQQALRRGVCLVNAGRYDLASQAFAEAERLNPGGVSPAAFLAAACVGQGRYDAAAESLGKAARQDPSNVRVQIRYALSLWKAGQAEDAVDALRSAIADHPESAELQFQLGTLLASMDRLEEAELRFTQAVALDRYHADALVSLACCAGARRDPLGALRYLERAQRRRPYDGRIGLLLAQAATACTQRGLSVAPRAEIPSEDLERDEEALDQLADIVAAEPEFVDAFCLLPGGERGSTMDTEVYAILAETLNRALDKAPDRAVLHCACGRFFERMNDCAKAVEATERAIGLDPGYTQALVQLGRLYQQVDRPADALLRLETALQQGARYADVYFMLGNLYQRSGWVEQARWAYEKALEINKQYEAARVALASLAA